MTKAADGGDSTEDSPAVLQRGALTAMVFFLIRAYSGLLFIVAALYALLSFITFTYFGFLYNPLIPWLAEFAKHFAWFLIACAAATTYTLRPDLRLQQTRLAAFVLSLGLFLAGAATLQWSFFELPNDFRSYFYSVLLLVPMPWMGFLDLYFARSTAPKSEAKPNSFWAFFVAGALVGGLSVAITLFRYGHKSVLHGPPSAGLILWTILAHAFVAGAIATILNFARGVAARFDRFGFLAVWLPDAIIALLLGLSVRRIALRSISLNDRRATAWSFAFALATIVFAEGTLLRGANLLPDSARRRRAAGWMALGAAVLLAILGPVVITTDWDATLLRMSVVLVWILAAFAVHRLWPPAAALAPRRNAALLAGCVAALALLVIFPQRVWPRMFGASASWNAQLDRYIAEDPSAALMSRILSSGYEDDRYKPFFDFLRRNSMLPASVQLTPHEIDLAPLEKPASTPNIFFFVIDSLRPDYLSPYNPAVTFTPNIAAFARDSVVFEHPFTRYGGTMLSEASIWAGSMVPHKQFVQPFYPMDSLERMLDHDGYEQWVTVDPVLEATLKKMKTVPRLDAKAPYWTDFDFVRTLEEIQLRIERRQDRSRPLFVYTQPQNVHVLTLSLRGSRSTSHQEYPGFERRHARELARMDEAFGHFLDFLKGSGLYDNSIIVFTADHGDALGELGRSGHTTMVYPQVIRIPLIIHWQKNFNLDCDRTNLAFTIDIVPSIYYALGHRPIANQDLLGAPLCTVHPEERAPYLRPWYMIVSSYAPVYAILSGDGGELFIANAAIDSNAFYNLKEDPDAEFNRVTPEIVDVNIKRIREQIEEMHRLYRYDPQ